MRKLQFQSTTSEIPVDSDQTMNNNEGSVYENNNNSSVPPESLNQERNSMKIFKPKLLAGLLIVALIAGIGTGLGGYQLSSDPSSQTVVPLAQIAGDEINPGDVFGSSDEKTFKDNAEGYLEIGGFNGEGSHKLLRPGGESQTVYLTSSITDLDRFEGMEIIIWGETFKGQKAGWLMDVGRVEIVSTSGSSPLEE